MPRVVEARIKKVPNDLLSHFDHFRILCGRETAAGQFECGRLGIILDITWPAGDDLLSCGDLYGYKGASDHPTLGTMNLTVGLTPAALAKAQVTLVPPSPPHHRIWVAYHERGYREWSDGAFVIMPRKSRWRTPHLIEGRRALGNRPMPESFMERIAPRANFPAGSGFEMPPDGFGVVGARPALPAVIRCPDCGAPNRVGALAFDEQRGIWYTVAPG